MSKSIKGILEANQIKIDACWIDNYSGQDYIDGIPVMGYREVVKKYHYFNVVFGHSKYELADEIVRRDSVNQCFCLVNVCYGQWNHLSYEFVRENIGEYKRTYDILSDEKSKKCLIDFLNCKINEDYHYLESAWDETAAYFNNPFFKRSKDDFLVDVGAYNGDSIEEFLSDNKDYKYIYAIEPERESFRLLENYISRNNLKNIRCINYGCWNENTTLYLSNDKERSSITDNEGDLLEVKTLDSIIGDKEVTTIKINFLVGVKETIEGAKNIINKYLPNMVVTVGFDEWGLIKIPRIIHKLEPSYKLSLRYASAMPARLLLFAYH